jgi:hypothetical protein
VSIHLNGTPFTGYLSLTNGATGPTAIAIFVGENSLAYTMQPKDRLILSSLLISSNDAAAPLVTIDDGPTARVLGKYYVAAAAPPTADYAGYAGIVCKTGVAPRASAPAVSTTKTVEIVIRGFLTNS